MLRFASPPYPRNETLKPRSHLVGTATTTFYSPVHGTDSIQLTGAHRRRRRRRSKTTITPSVRPQNTINTNTPEHAYYICREEAVHHSVDNNRAHKAKHTDTTRLQHASRAAERALAARAVACEGEAVACHMLACYARALPLSLTLCALC